MNDNLPEIERQQLPLGKGGSKLRLLRKVGRLGIVDLPVWSSRKTVYKIARRGGQLQKDRPIGDGAFSQFDESIVIGVLHQRRDHGLEWRASGIEQSVNVLEVDLVGFQPRGSQNDG